MPAARSRPVFFAYLALTSLFLLSFGLFNSVLKEAFHVQWHLLVLLLCAGVILLDLVAGAISAGEPRPRTLPGGMARSWLPALMGLYMLFLLLSWGLHQLELYALDPVALVNVQGYTVSYWRANNSQFLVFYLFFPVLYFFHARFLHRVDLLKLLRLVFGVFLISVCFLLYQAHLDPALLNKWDLPPLIKFDGLSSDPNAFALLAYLMLGAMAVGALLERSRGWRALYLGSTPLVLYAVYLTGCRTALVCLALLLLAIPVVIGLADRGGSRLRRWLLVGAPLGLLGAGVVSAPALVRQMATPGQGDTISRLAGTLAAIETHGLRDGLARTGPRVAAFDAGLTLVREAPLGGWGPGGFYREFSNVIFQDRGLILGQQHLLDSALNHFLMIGGDLGLIGALLNLFFVCLPLVFACRCFRSSSERRVRLAAGVTLCSQAIFLIFISVMPPSYFPEVIWIWTGMIALGGQLCPRPAGGGGRGRPWARRTMALVALGGLLLFCLGTYRSVHGPRGYRARWQAQWWPAEQLGEQGFYPFESIDGVRMHWTGRSAVSRLRATNDYLRFTLVVSPHNSRATGGLELRIQVVGHHTRTLRFAGPARQEVVIHAPGMAGKRVTLRLRVNRTFNPKQLGFSDDQRDLGVLVSEARWEGPR